MTKRCLLLLALAVMVSGCSPSAPAGGPVPRREGFVVTTDSARLYYRVIGNGADTLIAIHGGPGVDLMSIAGDFTPLTAHHVVIFYDQRGAGRSELPADTIRLLAPRQVADLDEVRSFFGIQQATLIAHSYGPLLAASYAIAHPERVRRMIFIGPIPPRRGSFYQRFGATMRSRLDSAAQARQAEAIGRLADPNSDAKQACREFWAIALKPRLAAPALTQPRIKSDLCGSEPAGIRYGLTITNRVVMASFGDWDLRARLRGLDMPVLVVYGEDEAIPGDLVEEWITALPRSRLLRVPGAAHFPYVERPEIVWPAVERFLAERREEKPTP